MTVPHQVQADYPVSPEGTEAASRMPVNDGLNGSGIKEYEYAVTEGPVSPEAGRVQPDKCEISEISADRLLLYGLLIVLITRAQTG